MDFPWKTGAAASAVVAYTASSFFEAKWPILAFSGYFVFTFLLLFISHSFWLIILYPNFFSPLRGLPEPKNSSWYNGQFEKIKALPLGVPMEEWYMTLLSRIKWKEEKRKEKKRRHTDCLPG